MRAALRLGGARRTMDGSDLDVKLAALAAGLNELLTEDADDEGRE